MIVLKEMYQKDNIHQIELIEEEVEYHHQQPSFHVQSIHRHQSNQFPFPALDQQ